MSMVKFEARLLIIDIGWRWRQIALRVLAFIETDPFSHITPRRFAMQLVVMIEVDIVRVRGARRMWRKVNRVMVRLSTFVSCNRVIVRQISPQASIQSTPAVQGSEAVEHSSDARRSASRDRLRLADPGLR